MKGDERGRRKSGREGWGRDTGMGSSRWWAALQRDCWAVRPMVVVAAAEGGG